MWPQKGSMRNILGVIELFCILIILVFTWIYTCVKIHSTVHPQKTMLLHSFKNSRISPPKHLRRSEVEPNNLHFSTYTYMCILMVLTKMVHTLRNTILAENVLDWKLENQSTETCQLIAMCPWMFACCYRLNSNPPKKPFQKILWSSNPQ